MKPLSILDVRNAVAGKAVTVIPQDFPPIVEICTDTRKMAKSSLFVALKGEKYDGAQFLAQAQAGGAIAAIVQDVPAELPKGLQVIHVKDTRVALGKLATIVRKQLQGKVVAVAGSNGKTSTKHLIAAALSGKLKGSHSPKSFNNEIGVPLTIFPADARQDFLVLEMGTNHTGEIRVLAKMALPDIAVITNCTAEHLAGLGDLIGVKHENASIVEGLDEKKGLLIVNGDDPELLKVLEHWKGRKLTIGFGKQNNLFATDIETDATGCRFTVNGNPKQRFFVPMLGRHTASNALAAIAVARRLGLSEEEIANGLANAQGPDMRLQLQKSGDVQVLNDAYNANPASMKAALETAGHLPVGSGGRRLAIVGDMLELGGSSERFHREVGEFAATQGFDHLVCVGPQAKWVKEAAIARGMDLAKVTHFEDSTAAAAVVPGWLRGGELVLLKGSRGMRLEKIAQAIADRRGGTPGVTLKSA
jgi:UDP-N-acetylmuramoyl-tripeptide--D-alanyl-D-alanine ligase